MAAESNEAEARKPACSNGNKGRTGRAASKLAAETDYRYASLAEARAKFSLEPASGQPY